MREVLNSPEFQDALRSPVDEETALQFQIAALQERLSALRMKRCRCVIGGRQLEPCPVHPYSYHEGGFPR
jgi:hypothetical protein